MPFLVISLLVGCAGDPASPADLKRHKLARVDVMSPAAWNLSAPAGQAIDVRISHVNNKNLCDGGGCPTSAEIPAGKGRLQVLCYLVSGEVRTLQGSSVYQGSFLAGHVYGINPQSAVPDCRIQLEDLTSHSS